MQIGFDDAAKRRSFREPAKAGCFNHPSQTTALEDTDSYAIPLNKDHVLVPCMEMPHRSALDALATVGHSLEPSASSTYCTVMLTSSAMQKKSSALILFATCPYRHRRCFVQVLFLNSANVRGNGAEFLYIISTPA